MAGDFNAAFKGLNQAEYSNHCVLNS